MERPPKKRIISEIDPKYDRKDWRQKKLRVCAYLRVSTDSGDQENSLKNQRAHYEKFIPQYPNWNYVGIFADEGISGTSLKNRLGFRQMVDACKAGKIDLIVVKEVSRFARNTKDCLNTVEELLTLDPPVGIFFENNNLNTLDAGNRVFLTMFAMFAELESELKSRSVDFGNQAVYDRGDYLCPTQNLLGYTKSGKYGLTIEPVGAKTVRLIYSMFLAGYPQKEIAETLMDLSLTTAKGNNIWSCAAVTGILRNEKYCGNIIGPKSFTISFLTHQSRRNSGQRRIFYDSAHHEAIVSEDEHVRALLLLKANRFSPFFNHTYEIKIIRNGLLSGFIPMNPAFGGYDAGHYLGALIMACIHTVDIAADIAHIAGAKRVRRELFCERNTASVTFSRNEILFNSVCMPLLSETEHVELLLHPGERLFAVRKTGRRNKNAVPWGSTAISAKEMLHVLYELMGWQKDWKYKVTANCFVKNNECVILFDLNCCEFRFKDGADKPTRAIPREWLTSFGEGLPEHMLLCRRALANNLDKWDIQTPPSAVEGFGCGLKTPARNEIEKMILEMRGSNGQRTAD